MIAKAQLAAPRVRAPFSAQTKRQPLWLAFLFDCSDLAIHNWPEKPRMGRSHRSVCVDYLYYNEDGTIREIIPTLSREKLESNTAFRGEY